MGTLGGLGVKTAALFATPSLHYLVGNFLGIVLGTIFNFLASHLGAFAKRGPA